MTRNVDDDNGRSKSDLSSMFVGFVAAREIGEYFVFFSFISIQSKAQHVRLNEKWDDVVGVGVGGADDSEDDSEKMYIVCIVKKGAFLAFRFSL